MSDKVMNFDQFAKTDTLQDPKTALKGDNVDPQKKEKFVDQVKRADLTTLTTNKPDYSATVENPINEDVNAIVTQLNALKPKIQQALETLTKAQKDYNDLRLQENQFEQQLAAEQAKSTTQTTTAAPTATQAAQNTPGIGGNPAGQPMAAPGSEE